MKFILGKKKNMTQLFMEDGRVVPVTAVKVFTNVITQVRDMERDGYVAVQIGTRAGSKNINKAQIGHCKGILECKVMREFRIRDGAGVPENMTRGVEFGVEIFRPGDRVRVTGVSKGKGFQGVVKRHNFAGASATHGTKDQLRMPGSIGATGPAHVFKGRKMPGRMGNDKVTVDGLTIVKIDHENSILYIKGALPGAFNSLVSIQGPGTFVVNKNVKKEASDEESVTDDKDDVKENEEQSESGQSDSKKQEEDSVDAEPAKDDDNGADENTDSDAESDESQNSGDDSSENEQTKESHDKQD